MVGERVPAEQHVREFARACVRSGLLPDPELHAEVEAAIREELRGVDDPAATAREWVATYRDELLADQETWPATTDWHRLQAAFADLEQLGVPVLQGCEDHWAARELLDETLLQDPFDEAGHYRGRPCGVAWFTPPDVWHAIDEGMLEVNLWHVDGANAAPGDGLLTEVLEIFERHGLPAHFDEGRIEVTARWQRPLGAAPTMGT